MKKQFQSKSVPRGTRTIWRYLGALFLLFTFAIGNVWAGVTIFSSVSQETTDGSWTITGSSNSASNQSNVVFPDPAAETGFPVGKVTASTAYYCKLSSSGDKGAKLATTKRITIEGLSAGDSIVVYWFATSTTSGKLCLSYATGASAGSYIEEITLGTIVTKQLYATSFKALTATDIDHIENGYSGSAKLAYISSNGPSPYVYAVKIISGSVTKHHVTYNLGGATGTTPTQADVAEGAKFTLHNGTTGITAPTNKDFDGWHDGTTKYAGGAEYTMGTSNVTLTAQWVDHVAKYTVKYMDGTTLLGTEEVNVTEHPAGLAENPKKDCYTFAAWSPALSGVSGSDGDEIEVNATWTPKYASTLDFAAVTIAGTTGANPIGTFLASGNMVASNLGGDSGWETSTAKSGFIGYKLKNTSAVIKFLVKAGKEVEITLGSVGAAAKLNKGGVESEIAQKSGDNEQTVIPAFVAESDMLVTITTNASSNSTVTLKKISIVDPAPKYTVTYDLNGATGTTPTEVSHKEGEKFNLHDGATGITAPTNKTFVNWKDQDDNEFAGGAEYTMPGENVTLTAQWAGDVYTVKFMDGETILDTKVVEVGSHPTDIEHPTKPLYTFAAWQLSGSDVVLDDVTGTKDATVILTARWAEAYASNVNFKEAATQALGVETALNTYHYASDAGDISFEEKGLKIKTNAARFYFNVAPGKVAEIKFGNISGATYSVDGGAAETLTSSQLKATYSASAQSCVMTMTTAAYNIVEKVTIHDPYQVTFDANDGDPVASQYGYPSVTLPLPVKGTESFLGWFDGDKNVGEAGDTYTPTANITLVAHWEAVSTDARLASISFSSDAGTLSPAFDPEETSYTYTMPYGTAAIPTITGATSVNAKAQDPIIGDAAAAWGDAQTIKGVAQSGDKKTYTITMVKAPKDGVCIIKATINSTTKNTIGEVTGLYKKDASCGGLSSYKFNGKGAYIGLELVAGQTFNEGDIINIHTTTAAGQGTIALYNDHGNTVSSFHDYGVMGGTGDNKFALPASAEEKSLIYVCRTEANTWNGYVDYIEVTRAMNPVLTAITIDERAGVIDPLDDKHFNVQIPYEADLANLTIVPTIAWNAPAAENSIVVNDGGAWVEGDNTYKLTDKDGDYTVYTLTLTRDVLKHTVSFNTHGGSAVASVEVEHNEYLTAVPNDPSKEDYIFKHWSLTDGGEEVDITTVQITENKEFHAVWAPDGAIKLLDGATVNHTNFITGVTADETVEFMGNTVNYAKFSNTCGSVNNVKDPTRVIAYNATTNKTKIRIYAHNNSTSGRNIYVKGLVEGASAAVDLANIALGNKEDKISDWIEFDNAANRTIYIMVPSSAGDVYFTQVKVIESGETPMKQAGEVGYSLNFNQGRFFGLKETTAQFEGMSVDIASSDCQPLSSSVVKVKEASMSFTAAAPVLLKVTTANNKTYYVANSTSGTTNETAKTGESEFNLAAGTWFINAGASEVQFTNIAFELPKAAKPVVADMDNVDYCQGSTIDELTVSATVSDGGTMLYQWYKDGVAIEGADEATYQPKADAEYYVVVVNTLTGHQNSDPTQSNTITVTGHAGTVISGTTGAEDWPGADVKISVTASGKNLSYAWYTCDDALGTNPVAVDPAVNAAELDVTVAAADSYYKVIVSGDCGSAQEAVITVVARQAVALQDVTGNMTWDFSKAEGGTTASSNMCNDEVLANVAGIVNNSDFTSDNIKATANKFKSGKLQASMIMFHTTVDGMITVVFSNTGGKDTERYLTVNGRKTDKGSKNETAVTYTGFVYAGDVVLGVVEGDGNMLNFTSVDFKATVDYPRTVNPNNIGTLCWTNDAVLGGATLYELAGKDANSKLVFDEVPENRLEAGKPYIFVPENGNTVIKVYNTTDDEPLTAPLDAINEMQGTFVDMTTVGTTEGDGDLWYKYIISNNHYIYVDYQNCNLGAYRAYFHSIDAIPAASEEPQQGSNGAPRRRLVVGGNNVPAVTTGVDNLNVGDQPIKVIIDGQMYILRGDKMYDATGRLVK